MSLKNNINLQEGSILFYPLMNFPTPHIPHLQCFTKNLESFGSYARPSIS